MKKLILGFLSLLLLTISVEAQDAKTALKDAEKAFNRYNLDPQNNKEDLKAAKDAIDGALTASEGQAIAKAWNTKGDIYNEIATQIVTVRQVGIGEESELPEAPNAPYDAYEAYVKGMELAVKKFEKKDAIKGLQNVQSNLSNFGVYKYESGDFDMAYKDFMAVLDAHSILTAEEETSTLDNPIELENQKYFAGLAALNANRLEEAKPLFQDLFESGFDKPTIYEAMYKIVSEEKSLEEAYTYLEQGREKFPDDSGLLFADINHALRTNQLDALLTKLDDAIAKEPGNVSLYTTTGNVYDQLYQKEVAAGNIEKADEHFQKAKEFFEKGRSIDPKNFDATYSIGTLYYNQAASMTQELNKLSDDYSAEGIKKYDAMKEQIFSKFDQALPYFQDCEKLKPSDLNTLIALKEIYARKDDLTMSDEFKSRLETVQGGGEIKESYFVKNQK